MATPPLISIDDLLAPISDDMPAGDTVPFTVRQKLEEMRKEVNPNDFAPDDPRRPTEPKSADWLGIIRLAEQTLREKSKDLLVAARLTEALTKAHGFAGLRDGLGFLRRLLEECWDRMNPEIEDGDLEVRAAPLNWLDDPDRGARFPTAIRMVPIVLMDGGGLGWIHWKQSQDGKAGRTPEQFEKATLTTPQAYAQNAVEDLDAAEKELQQLIAQLNLRLEASAPSMLAVGQAIHECLSLAREVLKRKGPADDHAAPEEEAPAAPAGGEAPVQAAAGGGGTMRRPRTRLEVYQALQESALLLQQLEPHSPVPYLILKAVEWGSLPFPELIKAMVRDENIISEMNRELGIKPPPTEE